MLDAKGLEAAKAVFNKTYVEKDGPLKAAITAYLEAVGGEPVQAPAVRVNGLADKLKLAEYVMTKDSFCEAERLEEGLSVVRRIRSALVATPPAERVVREYAQERHDATPELGAFNAGFRRAMKNIVAFCDARSALVEPGVEAEGRIRVPVGQTPLTDKLGHRYLDVIREGEKARDEGKGSPYHGHSLEHCLHATGWVQRDLRLALDATKSATPTADERVVKALVSEQEIDAAARQWITSAYDDRNDFSLRERMGMCLRAALAAKDGRS